MSDDMDNVRRFWAKAMRGVPPELADPHIDHDAITDMTIAVYKAIVVRLGHDDFAFVTYVFSLGGNLGVEVARQYAFGRSAPGPDGRPRHRRWMVRVLAQSARWARRSKRPPALHDAHIDDGAITAMAVPVGVDMARRLGHKRFGFIVAIRSGARTGEHGRTYLFGAGVHADNYRPDDLGLAQMTERAARYVRRESRP